MDLCGSENLHSTGGSPQLECRETENVNPDVMFIQGTRNMIKSSIPRHSGIKYKFFDVVLGFYH